MNMEYLYSKYCVIHTMLGNNYNKKGDGFLKHFFLVLKFLNTYRYDHKLVYQKTVLCMNLKAASFFFFLKAIFFYIKDIRFFFNTEILT